MAWFISKAWCDAIFNNTSPNYSVIACIALAHAQEFSQSNLDLLSKWLILKNFSSMDGIFLFSFANWNPDNMVSSAVFFIPNSSHIISFAGNLQFPIDTHLNVAMHAIQVVLQIVVDFNLRIQRNLIINPDSLELIRNNASSVTWCLTP